MNNLLSNQQVKAKALFIVVLISVSAGAFTLGMLSEQTSSKPSTSGIGNESTGSASQKSKSDSYSGWVTYKGTAYSFRFPPDWVVTKKPTPLGSIVEVGCGAFTACDPKDNVDYFIVSLVTSKSNDGYIKAIGTIGGQQYTTTSVNGLPAIRAL